jgi:uncharacterized MAPEG superfamily protein
MKPELTYLAYTAILTASLWIPYIACQVMTNGFLKAQNYADPAARPVPLWGKRAERVYMNAVETFAPFAALVVILQLMGKSNDTTIFCAAAFFWLRVAHAIVYWLGIPYIRTLVFTAAYACVVGLFVQVIR